MQRGITCQGRLIISESGDLGHPSILNNMDDNVLQECVGFNVIH